MTLEHEISACRLCAERFRHTATSHAPRPVVWFRPEPRILIASQAPGIKVHEKGMPFWDRSGDRLREWMGITKETFYDFNQVSVLPTAFCFPGYNAAGADLPPPKICWETWHTRCLSRIGTTRLRLVVGSYAIQRHLGIKEPLSTTIARWRDFAPGTFVLPHPSWRNNAWLRKNPWFTDEVLPALRQATREALADE